MSTTITHTDKKKSLAPKLRFKGFDEGWKKQTLFDISENVSYGMNAAATEYDGIHKYIRITDIDVNTGEFKPDPLTSPLGAIDEKFKLKQGDIVFARTGASVGKSHLYNPKDGALYFAGFLIKFSITKANPFFIYSLTLKEAYNKWVHIYSMRSGQPGLNAEEYKALKLNIPTLPEQQKIASFLSAVDEKIQQLTRKKELLEQYKKGVMQQLFSGKLRFKDENGKAFPKWEEKRIWEISEKKSSNIAANAVAENVGDYKIYGATGFLKTVDFYREEDPYISIVKDGAGVGRTLLCDAKTSVLGTLDIIKPIANVDLYFLYSVLNNIDFVKYTKGSTIPHIYFKDYSTEKIQLPHLEEQIKIANYLSNIDNKIESVTKQITQTQNFKKGLLQQMFV